MYEAGRTESKLRVLLSLALLASGCTGLAAARRPDVPERPDELNGRQLLELSDAFSASGDLIRAEQYLVLAQKRDVPERVVLSRLLALYVRDGQYRLATEHAEDFVRRHPRDGKARHFLASLYLAVGDDQHARRQFERLLSDDPDNAQAHYALASLLEASGHERATADQHYRAYLALEPEGAHAEEARAGLLTEVP